VVCQVGSVRRTRPGIARQAEARALRGWAGSQATAVVAPTISSAGSRVGEISPWVAATAARAKIWAAAPTIAAVSAGARRRVDSHVRKADNHAPDDEREHEVAGEFLLHAAGEHRGAAQLRGQAVREDVREADGRDGEAADVVLAELRVQPWAERAGERGGGARLVRGVEGPEKFAEGVRAQALLGEGGAQEFAAAGQVEGGEGGAASGERVVVEDERGGSVEVRAGQGGGDVAGVAGGGGEGVGRGVAAAVHLGEASGVAEPHERGRGVGDDTGRRYLSDRPDTDREDGGARGEGGGPRQRRGRGGRLGRAGAQELAQAGQDDADAEREDEGGERPDQGLALPRGVGQQEQRGEGDGQVQPGRAGLRAQRERRGDAEQREHQGAGDEQHERRAGGEHGDHGGAGPQAAQAEGQDEREEREVCDDPADWLRRIRRFFAEDECTYLDVRDVRDLRRIARELCMELRADRCSGGFGGHGGLQLNEQRVPICRHSIAAGSDGELGWCMHAAEVGEAQRIAAYVLAADAEQGTRHPGVDAGDRGAQRRRFESSGQRGLIFDPVEQVGVEPDAGLAGRRRGGRVSRQARGPSVSAIAGPRFVGGAAAVQHDEQAGAGAVLGGHEADARRR
jgi:hypothetical protein